MVFWVGGSGLSSELANRCGGGRVSSARGVVFCEMSGTVYGSAGSKGLSPMSALGEAMPSMKDGMGRGM